MSITIPRLTRDLPLSDYAPEMNGKTLKVWVNPSRSVTRRSLALTAKIDFFGANGLETPDAQNTFEIYAELLSQGEPETHVSVADLRETLEADPQLYVFITRRVWDIINKYRDGLIKKPVTPSELD
jgi:hypothetical protein